MLNRRTVLGGLSAAALAGCERSPPIPGSLTFWTLQLSPQFDDYVKAMLTAFEAENPGAKVRWVDVPWADAERKLLAAVAAQTAPDVVNLNPQFAARLAYAGALADPAPYVSAREQAQYLTSAWDGNRCRGTLFALPWYLSTPITIINRLLFAKANIVPPTQMSEILSTAVKMRERTGKYAYYPVLDGSRPMEDLVLFGANLLNQDGRGAGFNTSAGRNAFGFYRDLYQSGAVPRDVLTEGHQKSIDLFQSGELAMVVTGMEALSSIAVNAPLLVPHLAVMPQPVGANVPASIAAMNIAVLQSSHDKRLAFSLAKFVTSQSWQSRLAMRAPVLPSSVASLKQPPFVDHKDQDILLTQARKLSIAQLERGKVLVPPLPNYGKLKSSLQRNLQSAMIGQQSADAALNTTAKTWDALLSQTRTRLS